MAKNKTSQLTLKHKIGYGCGDGGGLFTFGLMSGFFTRYCLNILGVSTEMLASLLLVWNVWDAINDPMMGTLMDKAFAKNHDKRGKFRPWVLRATPMLAISAIALWTLPTMLEGTAMLAALFICKIFYEASYTMLNIPMGSMLSAMSDTDEERAQLSSARGFGSMIGGYASAMAFPLILEAFGDTAKGYSIGATIMALCGAVVCFFHYYWTEERHSDVSSDDDAANNIKVTDILVVFKKNRAFLALCVHSLFLCSMQAITGNVGTYMYADVLGSLGMMSTASLLSMPLSIVFLALAPKAAKKLGLTKLIRVGLITSAVLYVGLFALVMTIDINPWLYVVIATLAAGFSSLSILMQWGMVGEAIDYNEYLTGKRTEGSIYGTFSLTRRIGTTIGSSLGVLMLGWTGYEVGAAVQTTSALNGIKTLAVLVPAICVMGSWFAFKFIWNITDEVRAKMAAAKAAK